MSDQVLTVGQLLIGLVLMVAILTQAKGTGLGRAFGGSGQLYSTKRGVEKVLFRATFALVIVFIALSIARLL